ncbi:RNA polymerase sigma factor SigM [Gordonia sp. SID5947]|nr:RNA polymerase sigma factor SigM [Gordonia sp. SID5947]
MLRAHIAGEPDAFATLIERHHTYLWSLACRTSNNPDDAADALQDALLNAHRMAARFRSDAKVTSWLHRIVVNACLDRMRRNRVRRTVPIPEYDLLPLADDHDQMAAVDLSLSIGDALATLPPDQRAAVIAVDVEGYSVSEAAERLGVPVGTIKSRCSRGRLRLAHALGHLRDS